MIVKYIDRFQANAPNLRSKEIFLAKRLKKTSQILTSWDGQEITNGWEAQMVHLSELVTSRMCIFVSHDVSYLIIFVGELPLRDLLKWILYVGHGFSWEIPVEMLCDIIFWKVH